MAAHQLSRRRVPGSSPWGAEASGGFEPPRSQTASTALAHLFGLLVTNLDTINLSLSLTPAAAAVSDP